MAIGVNRHEEKSRILVLSLSSESIRLIIILTTSIPVVVCEAGCDSLSLSLSLLFTLSEVLCDDVHCYYRWTFSHCVFMCILHEEPLERLADDY